MCDQCVLLKNPFEERAKQREENDSKLNRRASRKKKISGGVISSY